VLYAAEFAITGVDGEAFRAAALTYDTKLKFARRVKLPFNDEYFGVPPGAPHGQQPKLGILHPSRIRRAEVAFKASNSTH